MKKIALSFLSAVCALFVSIASAQITPPFYNPANVNITGGNITGLGHVVSTTTPSFNSNAAVVNGVTFNGQIVGWNEDGTTVGVGVGTAVDSAAGSVLYGGKSRGTLAAQTAVIDGDILRSDYAVGHDGTDYAIGGYTQFAVSGTPGANDMPTSWSVFLSPDGTQTPVNALTIAPTGVATFAGSILTVDGAVGAPALSPASDATTGIWFPVAGEMAVSAGGTEFLRINATGDLTGPATVSTTGFTVATLPACTTAGVRTFVTDALAPAFLTAVVGGGAVVTPVFCNGANWVAG